MYLYTEPNLETELFSPQNNSRFGYPNRRDIKKQKPGWTGCLLKRERKEHERERAKAAAREEQRREEAAAMERRDMARRLEEAEKALERERNKPGFWAWAGAVLGTVSYTQKMYIVYLYWSKKSTPPLVSKCSDVFNTSWQYCELMYYGFRAVTHCCRSG